MPKSVLTQGAANDIALSQGSTYGRSKDVLKHQIWDTRYFSAGQFDNKTLFATQVGSPWRNNGQKTYNETNLVDQGKIPTGQEMLVRKFGVNFIIPVYDAVNVLGSTLMQACVNILNSSIFEIRILSRQFEFQIHGSAFTPMLSIFTSDATNNTSAASGVWMASGIVSLEPTPIKLDSQVSFSVEHILTNGDAAVQALITGNDIARLAAYYATMRVNLEGTLIRSK